MSIHLLDAIATCPASRFLREKQENLLQAATKELATMRYSIVLTAKWEAAASRDPERRDDLRAELVDLRRQYSHKIDEIAMTFSVQSAMDAVKQAERTAARPPAMEFEITPPEDDEPCI
jgi:hypothetical protein